MPAYLILLAALAADCPPYTKGSTGGDYNDADDAKGLSVVETFHFGPQVEALRRELKGLRDRSVSAATPVEESTDERPPHY